MGAKNSLVKNPKHIKKVLIVWGIALALTLPVFRSGLKSNLTLLQFVWNHTIYGDKVEFIPREDYEQAFNE